MKKHIIQNSSQNVSQRTLGGENPWIDVANLAEVELTSEDLLHPIEHALALGTFDGGWRASEPGKQVIRLVFENPIDVRRVVLVFEEISDTRTQEFTVRWSKDGQASQEVIRQQWTFSPPETVREIEDYQLNLTGMKMLELTLTPDIGGAGAVASLLQLRLS